MTPRSSVTRFASGLHEVNLQGFFPHPHWVVFLFSGLADLRVSVVEGRALQQAQEWDARFQLDFRQSLANPETVDFVKLAQQRPAPAAAAPPRLHSYVVTRRHDQSLEVRLNGPDQIGFLGRLLGEVSLLALFPVEMEIHTVAGRIQDRLVLRGIAGLAPGAHIEESLNSLLQGLTVA